MNAEVIVNRFQQMESSLSSRALIQVSYEGECLLLRTGEGAAQRSRLHLRSGSALGILAGPILAFFSPWGWVVSAMSAFVFLIAPRFITSHPLLKIDLAGQRLVILQHTGAPVDSVSFLDLRSLHGVYETRGWDPCNVVYAELQEGVKVPLFLLGGSEKQTIEACRILGNLLDCPATYTGPFGERLSCH